MHPLISRSKKPRVPVDWLYHTWQAQLETLTLEKIRLGCELTDRERFLPRRDALALRDYITRKIAANTRIYDEYLEPDHPFWEYACSKLGSHRFNLRYLCELRRHVIFKETFTGCFCTAYKSFMIDAYRNIQEIIDLIETAQRIGYPYDVVFINEEEQEEFLSYIAKHPIGKTRVVIWMNPYVSDLEGRPAPNIKERALPLRAQGIQTLSMRELGMLYHTLDGGASLRESLTGLDIWMDLFRKGKLLEITYDQVDERTGEKAFDAPYQIVEIGQLR